LCFQENLEGFGNLVGFWKPKDVLETPGDFGDPGRFWKPVTGYFAAF
jgi:hypothetical protein